MNEGMDKWMNEWSNNGIEDTEESDRGRKIEWEMSIKSVVRMIIVDTWI